MKSFKVLLPIVFLLFALGQTGAYSAEGNIRIEGVVTNVDLGQSNMAKQERLCLTTFRTVSPDKEIVLVEDIYLCRHARRLKDKVGHFAVVEEPDAFFLESDELEISLQRDYAPAEYKFLEVE